MIYLSRYNRTYYVVARNVCSISTLTLFILYSTVYYGIKNLEEKRTKEETLLFFFLFFALDFDFKYHPKLRMYSR